MANHATLSPSSAERWLECPASVRVIATLPVDNTSSPFAMEGTLAHELAEILGSAEYGAISTRTKNSRIKRWRQNLTKEGFADNEGEMYEHIAKYLDFVRERVNRVEGSVVLFEQRLKTGITGAWGTSDVVIFSPEHVEIIDLKYGRGVAVSALGNPQLRLYALGALDTFGDVLDETIEVHMSVYQPRIHNYSTDILTPAALRAWREEARDIATEALAGSDRFGPSESACRWCPAAGICKPRAEKMVALDFGRSPDLMTPEEMAEYLPKASEAASWASDLNAAALHAAYEEGAEIPGYKVVRSSGRRTITDPPAAVDALTAAGFKREDVVKPPVLAMQTLGNLEKLVGKKELPDILGDLLAKSEGKPSLVTADDKREAINRVGDAALDFAD